LEDKCLRALGITEISLLVISHFHADHVGGLTGLLNGRRVGKVWISSNFAPESESKLALGLMRTLSIEQVHQGDKAEISSEVGAIKIRVLWPNYIEQSVSTMPSDGSAINNSSVALMIDAPEFSLFVGGDIEPSVQEVLLPLISKVDIYKVSHHGSRYQSLPFMAALSPRISLISVGEGNPYGHPAVETLAALTRLGSRVYRSDKDGNIAISIKQHKISIKRSGG
jgi:competence protein ComEC